MICGVSGTVAVGALAASVTAMLLALNMSVDLGGYGAGKIFAYHPVFMCLAFLLFMPLGMLSYKADLGEKGNSIYPDTESRRLLHGTFNLIAVLLMLAGYLVAFVYHQAKGIEHLALTENQGTLSRPAHVFLGLFALGGAILQASGGLYKYVVITRDRAKILKLHGRLGPLVWTLGLLCIGLAAWFEYLEGEGHWTLGQAGAIWTGLVALFAAVTAYSHMGTRDHAGKGGEEGDFFIKRAGLLLQ